LQSKTPILLFPTTDVAIGGIAQLHGKQIIGRVFVRYIVRGQSDATRRGPVIDLVQKAVGVVVVIYGLEVSAHFLSEGIVQRIKSRGFFYGFGQAVPAYFRFIGPAAIVVKIRLSQRVTCATDPHILWACDELVGKKKLKDALSGVLNDVK